MIPSPCLVTDPARVLATSQRLTVAERLHVRLVQRTLEPGPLASTVCWCQRHVGATWIHLATRKLLHVSGEERLPSFDPHQSYLLVANHRTFFDLYAITAHLVRTGLSHRILFPVRSAFFYDRPLGMAVNGAMSFFAMYPPIFRDPKKVVLNLTSLDELASQLRRGGVLAGVHPEGTRNRGEDPYQLLPAQRGIGRVIYQSRVVVLPVFVHGLAQRLGEQLWNNRDPRRHPVFIVFGSPVPLEDLLERKSSPRVHQAIADRTLGAVAALSEEERRLRAVFAAAH